MPALSLSRRQPGYEEYRNPQRLCQKTDNLGINNGSTAFAFTTAIDEELANAVTVKVRDSDRLHSRRLVT